MRMSRKRNYILASDKTRNYYKFAYQILLFISFTKSQEIETKFTLTVTNNVPQEIFLRICHSRSPKKHMLYYK